MLRTRTTKCSFSGRWSISNLCKICCKLKTDEHLFSCPGYNDINNGVIQEHTKYCTGKSLSHVSTLIAVSTNIINNRIWNGIMACSFH